MQGPKGKLRQAVPPGVVFAQEERHARREAGARRPELRKFHGLARSLVANAVTGVTEGFKKELDIVGVGYRAELKGKQVHFALGYSHPIVFDIPTGIDIAIEKQTHITVTGADRQLVGQVAANIRRMRKPDPYKQKGVRYTGEVLKKKVGKTGASKRHVHGHSQALGVGSGNGSEDTDADQDQRGSSRPDQAPDSQAGAGTEARPRLTVFRSVAHIYVQVVDDMTGRTIASASSVEPIRQGRAGHERRRAATSPAPRRSARPSPRGCSRRASSGWCSTATGSSITGA